MSHRLRVGVLRGGPSAEYEVSLNSGAAVINSLNERYKDRFRPIDIFINKKGIWHIDGIPVKPEQVIHRIDVAWNALHGAFGEDGKIQHFFEVHRTPFTGSGSLGSALGMNKMMAKKIFRDHDIKTPLEREILSDEILSSSGMDALIKNLFNTLLLPAVIKPISSGSSIGVSVVRTYGELPVALALAAKHGDSVIVEEFIPGIEATCGVIEDFRGQTLYALPPVEIRPTTVFFDYEAKYNGKSLEIIPATFTDKIKKNIEDISCRIHRALGLRHYSRSDFIIHPRRGVYALEVNTLPGLTDESLLPKSLRAVGSDIHELVGHTIGLAMRR
ncbi:MAG: D-alanine--D-alanine ligase [Candidatus Paceibacterota bacterium]|jgi:D-alanine-D-alanine ligase